jgi:hypothetical protein
MTTETQEVAEPCLAARGVGRLTIRMEPCGCVRLRCSAGCSPDMIARALDMDLSELLCPGHKDGR